MNRDKILRMSAGREMDLLICEHVMQIRTRCTVTEYLGKEVVRRDYAAIINHEEVEMPYYSTDIDAAWNVVGKKEIDGWSCVVENLRGAWQCTFAKIGNTGAYCTAKLAPLAICQAALLTVIPNTDERGLTLRAADGDQPCPHCGSIPCLGQFDASDE